MSNDINEYFDQADVDLDSSYDEPMSLEEYVELIMENPDLASHAARYLLRAIESTGTRTVIEEGEEKERYIFFDDPYNDGEHAILGNTEVLNRFVADLRAIASGRGKQEKIIWFDGPTATGKSELKRCLVNGLREFSKTPQGRRYTIEWNTNTASESGRGLSYGEEQEPREEDWYRSPIQSHPLSVFPNDIRQKIINDMNKQISNNQPVRVEQELDPFSRESFDNLEQYYRSKGSENVFSDVTSRQHLRVRNYVMDVGNGIGILHAEDDGSPNQRLVGEWMRGMLRELRSKGRKNPQAFDYNGVIAQGNSGITIVEEASNHADLLKQMLSIPDEEQVKLDKGIQMDIDTCLIIISNPVLTEQLDQHSDRQQSDPLKALKRRLQKHEFKYLTNLSLETMLLYRELKGQSVIWEADEYEDLQKKIRSPVTLVVSDEGEIRERELSPHSLEAAAMFNIISRLDVNDLPEELTITEKALLFDRGYIIKGDERYEKEDFDFSEESKDGTNGIPVTFTRDIITDIIQSGGQERVHSEYPVEDVIMPREILNTMVENLSEAPVISDREAKEFENRIQQVKSYIFNEQEKDVLDALLRDRTVDEELITEYIQQVDAWEGNGTLVNVEGENVEPDPLKMKIFETRHLGRFDEEDYGSNNEPSEEVKDFREERVMNSLNKYVWDQREEDFKVSEIKPKEIDLFDDILERNDWETVMRNYPDFDPYQWESPPSDTVTEELKEKTIQNMMEMFDYSRGSAELTSLHVIDQVAFKWDEESELVE